MRFLAFGVALLLLTSFSLSQVLVQRFELGKYDYIIQLKKLYSHDDDADVTYYIVKSVRDNKELCSSIKLAERGNKLFIQGAYRVNKGSLQFTERYLYHRNEESSDSIVKTFTSNPKGALVLSKVTNYKHGKAAITSY
ncbi:hypothetical protein [Hymenobacter terrestris]|uniref:Uncharacterized protein n=1 Tax=Hymenobacter terrestris TaxID=2748310 RepID=A0ABX2Q107_9BACT|nr:hypothetical protein [Hymenobacter terrestris]NVO84636.1 hypothetical protein [Hymenobacter terrestris]